MVLPFMTLYLTESKGVSIAQAGLVMTIFGLGTICGGLIGGKLTDKLGFYYIQLLSLLGGGVMYILLGQMKSYTAICITAFFVSLINESFRPANAAAIAHYSETKNRTRSFTLNRLAINLGWAVGGVVGGFVAGKSYHLLFWIDGLTCIGAAILLWLLLAPSRSKHKTQNTEPETAPERSAYKDHPFIIFLVLNTLFACCFFQIFTTIPVFLKQDMLMSESDIGIILALNGLIIALIEMVVIHQLENRMHVLAFVIIGTLLVAMGFASLNLIPGAFNVALIFMFFVTVGEIINMPFAATYWANRATSKNRGQYAGLFTISWAVAQIAGPSLGAVIAQYYGFGNLWWIVAGVCFSTIAGYRWLQVKEKAD